MIAVRSVIGEHLSTQVIIPRDLVLTDMFSMFNNCGWRWFRGNELKTNAEFLEKILFGQLKWRLHGTFFIVYLYTLFYILSECLSKLLNGYIIETF